MSSFSEPPTQEPTNEELWTQPPSDPGAAHVPAVMPTPGSPPSALPPAVTTKEPAHHGGALALAITSLALAIPLTAIASDTGGFAGLVISWISIVAVNVAFSFSKRPRRQ